MVMRTRLAAALLLVLATPAQAGPVVQLKSEPTWSLTVPPRCEKFLPPGDVTHPLHWDRWLSLASCLCDNTRQSVDDPFDVPEMVADLSLALMPAMLMWRDALGEAPLRTQLYAAYHVGLAAVGLITRARSSIVAGPSRTGEDARARERVLRDRLEPLLVPAKSMAWTAFKAVDNEAALQVDQELDPVTRAMVTSARQMLQVLETPADPSIRLVQD